MKQEIYQDSEPLYNTNSYLEDWVFHYNSLRDQWSAIPRETYNEYWNDFSNPKVLRSKELDTLLELLHKTKGNKDFIEKLLND
jgi:hypothetical protein